MQWCCRFLPILLGLAAAVPTGLAQEPCDSCPGYALDAATANWLAWEGFDEADYTLVFVWEERPRRAESLVTGYRLAPRAGGVAVDVYRDAAWQRLDAGECDALGIAPKRWDAPPVKTAPQLAPAFIKTTREAATLPASALTAGPAIRSSLPPLDLGAVLREDAERAASGVKGGLRYGVRRALPVPMRLQGPESMPAAWTPGGAGPRMATLRLDAPGAVGMRVRVEADTLPEGSRLFLYSALHPEERYGPFQPEGDWWSPTCFADSVVIAVEIPDGGAVVDLRIPEVSHLYRSLDSLPFAKQAGACNNDVTCFPEWANAALGVGGTGSINQVGSIWCTGSLLADTNPATAHPYFVTANHCVGSSSQANTVEVYWLFQTAACDGAPPDPAEVPRTLGGADLLVTSSFSSGTDFTLLLLRENPPEGLVYLGFDSAPQALGTPVTCIHHPRGTHKRISFGDLVDSGSPSGGGTPLANPARYHEALWNNGTTEPGSSGSPLLVGASQLFIGQLWGGRASCAFPDEPDYYGRFDVSFPLAADWLHGGLEPPNPDVDGSGRVDALDLQIVIRAALRLGDHPGADVDHNGVVDARDLQLVVQAILQGGKAS